MPPRPRPAALVVFTLCVLTLGAAGCGRRGALEAPSGAPQPSTVSATPTTLATRPGAVLTDSPDSETDDGATATFVSPQPNPTRRQRGYTVPKDPFILDPLL